MHHISNIIYPLVILIECGSVLGQESDDEVVGAVSDVIDEGSDAVDIDRFQRVDQHDRDGVVHLVDEIARQREHEAGDFAFAFREVIDSVFVGGSRIDATDHVQVECALSDRAAALADFMLSALDPDTFEVGIAEQFENDRHVLVKLLDGLFFDLC